MKLNKVTLTGPDDEIYYKDLIDLQVRLPFVEWGILFSVNKEGTLRYPSLKWERGFSVYGERGLNLSAHLCGWHARELMENSRIDILDRRKSYYKRFQVNYNFSYTDKWAFSPIIDWAENNPNNSIIFQENKSNKKALRDAELYLPKNIHFLYDASGGRGSEITDMDGKMPFNGRYTGYAGGISTKNVEQICIELVQTEFKDEVWIDMESGVRTDNHFNLNKCIDVLEICNQYINK